jgi:hypothetical protein
MDLQELATCHGRRRIPCIYHIFVYLQTILSGFKVAGKRSFPGDGKSPRWDMAE